MSKLQQSREAIALLQLLRNITKFVEENPALDSDVFFQTLNIGFKEDIYEEILDIMGVPPETEKNCRDWATEIMYDYAVGTITQEKFFEEIFNNL